jgi:hypothetical protein
MRTPGSTVWLTPDDVRPSRMRSAIAEADLIVPGPGSLFYTSPLPSLLIPRHPRSPWRRARRVSCNVATQEGETPASTSPARRGAASHTRRRARRRHRREQPLSRPEARRTGRPSPFVRWPPAVDPVPRLVLEDRRCRQRAPTSRPDAPDRGTGRRARQRDRRARAGPSSRTARGLACPAPNATSSSPCAPSCRRDRPRPRL